MNTDNSVKSSGVVGARRWVKGGNWGTFVVLPTVKNNEQKQNIMLYNGYIW